MEPTNYIVITKSDPLTVRDAPDGAPTGISKHKGSSVLVTELRNGWAKIDEGWVSEKYLMQVQKGNPAAAAAAAATPVTESKEERAPWMKVVLDEAKNYGGYHEATEPLKSRIKTAYFSQGLESANSQSDPHEISWCASFASWCLKTAGYSNPRSQRALEFDPAYKFDPAKDKKSGMRKITEPVYGCIIVFKNKSGIGGHVAFYYGKDVNGNIIALGGNQGQSLQFSTRNPNGDRIQTIAGYFLPENYQDNPNDKFTANDLNLTAASLNSSALLAKHGTDSTAT